MESYCLSCKTKTEMVNPVETVTKNGRSALKGSCSNCSKNVSKMIKGPATIKHPVKLKENVVDDSNLSKKPEQTGGLILPASVIIPLALKMSLPFLVAGLEPLLKLAGLALASYLIKRFELFGLIGQGMNIVGLLGMLAMETNPYRRILLKIDIALKAHELLASIKDKFIGNRKKAVTAKLRSSKKDIETIVQRLPDLDGLEDEELANIAEADGKKLDSLIKSLDKLYTEQAQADSTDQDADQSEEQTGGEVEEPEEIEEVKKTTRGKLVIRGSTKKGSS